MSKKLEFDISKMMEALSQSMPTREESYEEAVVNPNSFNFWFRRLVGYDNTSPFKIPETVCFELPFDRWEWLTSDSYKPEDIQEFSNYLNGVLRRSGMKPKEYFIKTGTFSNKFDFEKCHITDTSQLGDKFLDVFYNDMMFGAGSTPHVVIREFIPSNAKYYIYNGMPLRRELRFFWDFDEGKLLGHSLYWHPEDMKQLVKGMFENDNAIEKFFANHHAMTEMEIYNDDKFTSLRDYIIFRKFHEENKDEYEKDLANIIPELTNFLLANKDLTADPLKGKWSVDIMHEDGEYYLIDAAQMEKSALVNRMVFCDDIEN